MSNRNRVPKKQWRKWSANGQRVFNEMYGLMMRDPRLFQHTSAPTAKPFHWKVTAWNTAWIAADAVDECVPLEAVPTSRRGRVAA